MKSFPHAIVGAILLLVFPHEAHAQTAVDRFVPADQTFLDSPEYLSSLKAQFAQLELPERRGSCNNIQASRRLRVRLLSPILQAISADGATPLQRPDEFAGNNYSVGITGSWWEIWVVSVCGSDQIRGMVVSGIAILGCWIICRPPRCENTCSVRQPVGNLASTGVFGAALLSSLVAILNLKAQLVVGCPLLVCDT